MRKQENLVNNGAQELTLLGQNVSAYNSFVYKDLMKNGVSLAGLCKILSSLDKLKKDKIFDFTSKGHF